MQQLRTRCQEIVDVCKTEIREMTEEEKAEFDANKEEIKALNDELTELKAKLREYEDETPKEGEEEKDCGGKEGEEDREEEDKNIEKENRMKDNVSLIAELRNAAATGGTINLTELQKRAAVTVAAEGEDVVQKNIYDILAPLRANSALVKAGAQVYGNVQGHSIQIPVMSKSNVLWKGETGDAEDGAPTFTSVELTPKRITAFCEISLEMLNQQTPDVEGAIINDIYAAVGEKLEATLLSDGNETNQPTGLANGLTPVEVEDYEDLTYMEALAEEANIDQLGGFHYIVSPRAKAALRSMKKADNGTGMVWENNEVDGTPATWTSNVATSYAFFGNFNNVKIAQFGDVELEVVRDSASLKKGCVTVVVNAFFDGVNARPESVQYAYLG